MRLKPVKHLVHCYDTFSAEEVHSIYNTKKYSLHDTDLMEVIKMTELLDDPPGNRDCGYPAKDH